MKSIILSLCLVFLLSQTGRAMNMAPSNNDLLNKKCLALGEQNGHEYFLVTGRVINSRIKGVEPPVDCLGNEKCHELQGMAAVFAQLKIDDSENSVSVRTKPESYEVLKKMESIYLAADRSYSFCARTESPTNSSKTDTYIIDYPDTIQLIE